MKTVQIFMTEENKELIYDNNQLDEFKSLVYELGLLCDNRINSEKSPIPFTWLDQATIRAFKLICPQFDKIENYRLEIPLEILRNVKLSKVENYFDWIEVWHNAKNPDPFAVGVVYKNAQAREKGYSWEVEYYLIGRWGDENKTIPELMEIATNIATQRIQMYAESAMAKLESWKKCPEVWAKNFIYKNDSEASQAIGDSNSMPF